jgi:hypothetical protein
VDTGEIKNASRAFIAKNFGRTRLAPQVGIPLDLATGKDVTGDPVTLKDAALSGVEYLSGRDISEAVNAERRKGGSSARGAALGALSIIGVGVSTYSRRATPKAETITNQQKSFIYTLADSLKINEDEEAHVVAGKRVPELTKEEASELIERLKKKRDAARK